MEIAYKLTDGELSTAIQMVDKWDLKANLHPEFLEKVCESVAKAAQLQLIEWLEETCTEHGPFGREGYGMRYFCPVCRAELKKQLREE
jgi:hypothetical protein